MNAPQSSLAAEILLLNTIKAFNDRAVRQVSALMYDSQSSSLAKEYAECLKKREVDLGFNLFAIVSDLYYRETFHSDILGALLDPKSQHKEGDKYLRLFLTFLRNRGAALSLSNYRNVCVVREEGRIDLLIRDEDSKKALIVENKINDAVDMYRQIPRYLDHVKNAGYVCEAIIYLRLNRDQQPNKKDWTNEETAEIDKKLTCIIAYDDTDNDLLNGWILECYNSSKNADAKHIFSQYGALIKKLGGNIMNKPIMNQFYSMMLKDENFKTAQSLKAMFDDLILYRVERIIDEFKKDLHPFKRIANYKDNDAYFTGLTWKQADLGFDIIVEPGRYLFQFWDRSDSSGTNKRARSALEKMNCIRGYTVEGGLFQKTFAFPAQEAELFEHIRAFKKKLADTLKVETPAVLTAP